MVAHQLVDQAVAWLLTAGVMATGKVLDAREERAAELIVQRAKSWRSSSSWWELNTASGC
jgi:hypothetical protein